MSEGRGLRHAQWEDAQWGRVGAAVGGGAVRASGGLGGRISGGVNRGASPPDAPSRRANSAIFAAPLVVLMACFGVLPAEDRLPRAVQHEAARSRAHQPEENSMRVLGRTGVVAVAAGGLGLAASSIALGQELVVNGGFEQSNYAGDCCPICGSAITIPGWQAFRVDHLRNAALSPADERWVDLNQCSAGWVQQTVPTLVDRKYRLRFLLGSIGFSGCTPAARLVKVTFGPLVETIAIQEAEGITAHEFTVTATSDQSLLRFEGLTGGCNSGDLDNVSIEAILCGDVDNSGFADAIDLAIVLANWGVPSPKYPGADIDQNGVVDGADLSILLSSWGACP